MSRIRENAAPTAMSYINPVAILANMTPREADIAALRGMYGDAIAKVIITFDKATWWRPNLYYERRLKWKWFETIAFADDLNDDPAQLVHELAAVASESIVRGKMNFMFYTFDPGEHPTRFRTIQICEHALLIEALQEFNRQVENLAQNGIFREGVAWEAFEGERPVTTTFEDTEKRVRFIVDNYGKAGSGVSHGVLDLEMARKLVGAVPESVAIGPRPKLPVEAHMPKEQKASADACMLAVRIACGGKAEHDPLKKFAKKD